MNKRSENAIRWIANLFALAGFLVSLPLWFWYDSAEPGVAVRRAGGSGSRRSAPSTSSASTASASLLILLTTLMGVIAVLSSWTAITERVKEYYIFLLVLQTGMIGAFVSLDFLLFFLFWEVMLVPMYFLIGIWGSDRRLYSAIKFFLYTLVGSVVMLLGILALYFYYHDVDRASTRSTSPSSSSSSFARNLQWWVFLAFFLGLLDQGADVPVPHLAARRAHRRADGRLGHPGGRPPEDGDVRVHPLQPADPARRDARRSSR